MLAMSIAAHGPLPVNSLLRTTLTYACLLLTMAHVDRRAKCRRLSEQCWRLRHVHADLRRRSFLHWIVCGIDVRDAPRPYPVHLNDRLLFRPAKVVRLRRHDGDASRRQRFGLGRIELVAGAEMERAGNHRDVLD